MKKLTADEKAQIRVLTHEGTTVVPWLRKNMQDMQELNRLCLRYGTMQIVTFLLRRLSVNLNLAAEDRRTAAPVSIVRAYLADAALLVAGQLAEKL